MLHCISTAVIGRLPCGLGALECAPGVPERMRSGRVHGRFRVERLIPTSFNQTPRLLRRTQALEIDEAVHATIVQTIIGFVVRDLACVASIRPGQSA
jgi:hypothetical protein